MVDFLVDVWEQDGLYDWIKLENFYTSFFFASCITYTPLVQIVVYLFIRLGHLDGVKKDVLLVGILH